MKAFEVILEKNCLKPINGEIIHIYIYMIPIFNAQNVLNPLLTLTDTCAVALPPK